MAPVRKKARRSRAAELVHEINAALGKSALRLGNDPYFEIVRIPTGSLTIDRLTGGGFPLGRHVELYGEESACKSYIQYRTMALSQARGNLCALIDPEHSFEADWFRHVGGDPDTLILEQPEIAEDAINTMMLLFQSGEIEVVGIDSVAALLTKEEREKDVREGDDRVASQARMMSRALRRLTTVNSKTLVLWTNQLRSKIGVSFGNPNTTPGGRALKFYDTSRIEFRRGELVKGMHKKAKKSQIVDAPVTIGHWVQCLSQKEKSTRPHMQGAFVFDNVRAEIDQASEIIQLALEDGTIVRTGNKFSYTDIDGEEWSGLEKAFKKQIDDNDELREELIELIQDATLDLAAPGGK